MRYMLYMLLTAGMTLGACSAEEEPMMMSTPTPVTPVDNLPVAPAWSFETTDGQTVESSQFEDKVLVIFFFGADCPPCKRVGPDIESEIHQAFKDNDKFAIVGADQWNLNDNAVDNFAEVTGITFPVGKQGASMAKDFNTTYDRIVVVNENNKIAYASTTRVGGKVEEIVEVVKDLLK